MAIAVVAEPSKMSDEEGEIITWEVNGPNQPTLSDDLTSEQKQQMKEMMNKREKAFHPVPGKTNLVEHSIRLSQTVPVRTSMYRIPAALQDPVHKELKLLLKQGLIEPSTTPWSHSLVPVKKLKTIPMEARLCRDFRPINVDTFSNPYLMPWTEELLDRIGNVKFISVFDLRKEFLSGSDERRGQAKDSLYVHNVKNSVYEDAFLLEGAPATFQRLMDILLDGTNLYAAGAWTI